MSEFAGKVAVVTGASTGIGRRTAELLAERGAPVVALARTTQGLDELASRSSGRIRVNTVNPGSVDTKMWAAAKWRRSGGESSQEAAETILFLASDRCRRINGQNLHVYSA